MSGFTRFQNRMLLITSIMFFIILAGLGFEDVKQQNSVTGMVIADSADQIELNYVEKEFCRQDCMDICPSKEIDFWESKACIAQCEVEC